MGGDVDNIRWPAMMTRKTASLYCDVSIASFEREIVAGRLPSGVMLGGREHWHKPALDAALARIAGEVDDMPEYRRKHRERYGKAA